MIVRNLTYGPLNPGSQLTLEVMKLVGDKRENGKWRKKLGKVICAPFVVFRSSAKAKTEERKDREVREKKKGNGGKGEVEIINLEDWY